MTLSGVSTDESVDHLQRRRNVSNNDGARLADVSKMHSTAIIEKVKAQVHPQKTQPPRLVKQDSSSGTEEDPEDLDDYYD